jgi:site-specific DNA-methyltransferase (adenine-specific)
VLQLRALNSPAEITERIRELSQHIRKGHPYYWAIGKTWLEIKSDPVTDEIGIDALKPYLPVSVQWLNRCAVAYDGHNTGDLERGERYAQQIGYHPRYSEEPYRMAELTDLWRNKKPPRRRRNLPLAMIAGRIFVRSTTVEFLHGTALLGDCHTLIEDVPDGIIDAVINDPPFGLWGGSSHGHFGKIGHAWDKPLNWERLWPHIWRVLTPTGNVVISATEPLVSTLITAQLEHFLYCRYWLRRATNIYGPRHGRPLSIIEPVAVFSQVGHTERTYHPEMRDLGEIVDRLRDPWRRRLFSPLLSELESQAQRMSYRSLAPVDLISVERTVFDKPHIQHGQKPVALMRYLVRTYTNPGDLILDITAGSMTTAIAAASEDRRFITFEQDRKHFALGTQRLRDLYAARKLPEVLW